MKKKKLYPILTILVLVIFFATVLLSMGCKEDPEIKMNREMAEQIREQQEAKAEEAEQLAIDKQVRQDEAEQRALDEAIDQMEREEWAEEEEEAAKKEAAEEEEKLIPNELITYSANIDGLAVILIVNFETLEVTGSLSFSGEDYIDAPINGKIDMNTFKITSNYSGIAGTKVLGEFPFNGTINGKITEDLSTFNGEILNDEGKGREFTLTK